MSRSLSAATLTASGGTTARALSDKLGDSLSVKDFGTAVDATSVAAAIGQADGRVVEVPVAGDDTQLPADYTGALVEYKGERPARFTHTATIAGTAKKAYKAQFPAGHPDTIQSALHIEAQAIGSGKNGPSSADFGMTIAIHKKDYGADTSPPAGEIDGLKIYVRQDGPKGEPSGGANSSDASGILLNVQNVEDVGFTSAWEATTSNVERAGDTITKSVQTQIGVLNQNAVGTPSYGYVCVATTGALGDAYYAGTSGGATWENVLNAPGSVKIDATGNYRAYSTDWAGGAWTIVRAAGANGATQLTHRGTGALFFYAQDAGAIQFGTNGNIRWEINSSGNLLPVTDGAVTIGAASKRAVNVFTRQVNVGTTSTNGAIIVTGTGTPEGAVTANIGSLYLRLDGGASTTLYVKQSGTGNTGWVAK